MSSEEGSNCFLPELLAQTFDSPKQVNSETGGDVLFLCLHCLMIYEGYEALDTEGQTVKGYQPPRDIWREHPNEWVIEYTREGSSRCFRLHCSLQPATGRMFVHASELKEVKGEPLRDNIQVLGLQLSNYVDRESCQSESWVNFNTESSTDVISNERTLKEMFQEFVLEPLWSNAEKERKVNTPEQRSETKAARSLTETMTMNSQKTSQNDDVVDDDDNEKMNITNKTNLSNSTDVQESFLPFLHEPNNTRWMTRMATSTGILAASALIGYFLIQRNRSN